MATDRRFTGGDGTSRPDDGPAARDDLGLANEGSVDSVRVDGRRLAYATYGDPDGRPVLVHHGSPGSRLVGRLLDGAARERGLRLVAPDRPGFGRSTHDPDRTVPDWAVDAVAVLDALGIERASVVGFSGGGPFALAVAAARPDRVERVVLASASGPPSASTAPATDPAVRVLRTVARRTPVLLGPLLGLQRRLLDRQDPAAVASLFTDRDLPTDVAETVAADVRAAFRDGAAGPALESRLLVRPWGIDLGAVTATTTVVCGTDDRNVPPDAAEVLADALPAATLVRREGDDHLGPLLDAGALLDRA